MIILAAVLQALLQPTLRQKRAESGGNRDSLRVAVHHAERDRSATPPPRSSSLAVRRGGGALCPQATREPAPLAT